MTDAHEAARGERRAVAREWLIQNGVTTYHLPSLAALLTSREAAAVATAMAELQVRVRRTGLLENEKITRKKMAEIIERIAPTLRDQPTFADTWRAVEAAARAGAIEDAAGVCDQRILSHQLSTTCADTPTANAIIQVRISETQDVAVLIRSLAALPPDRVVVRREVLEHAEGWMHAGHEGPCAWCDELRAALARLGESDAGQ